VVRSLSVQARGVLRTVLWVLPSAVVLGVATSYAQGFLPAAVNSFANSASGWTLVTALLILAARARPLLAGFLGAGCFVLLTLGYTAASALRGLTYDPTLFSVVGVVVGPFVGVATSWLSGRDLRAAVGTAALSGIAVGEAVYGLTVVSDSTSPVYWSVIGVVGLGLLGVVCGRIRRPGPVALALSLTAVVATGFVGAYARL